MRGNYFLSFFLCNSSPAREPLVTSTPSSGANFQRSYSSRQPRNKGRGSLPPIDDIHDPLRPRWVT